MEENWHYIELAPHYDISDQGRVRTEAGKVLKGQETKSGYIQVLLYTDGKPIAYKVHRLVAHAFIPNPENLPVVNHKDGIRKNNTVTNLEWVTHKINMEKMVFHNRERCCGKALIQSALNGDFIAEWKSARDAAHVVGCADSGISRACNGYSKSCKGFLWRYKEEQIIGEVWRTIEYQGRAFEVSSLGRVKDEKRNRLTFGSTEGGYRKFGAIFVHRLIATGFCEKEDGSEIVNHKDGNPHNNSASNLEWTTTRGNAYHSHYLAPEGKCATKIPKPVRQFLPDGTVVDHLSQSEAARVVGIGSSDISKACRGKAKMAGGCRWEFIKKEIPLRIIVAISDDDPIWKELGLSDSPVMPNP